MELNEKTEPAKVSEIGVGTVGHHHARGYSELPGVNLVGVYDIDDEQGRQIANDFDTRALSMDAVLDATDTASIAVPTRYHAEIAERCIDHGVDLLIEKPFVDNPATVRELLDRDDEAGVTVQVGHVERFNPAIRALADISVTVIGCSSNIYGSPCRVW